MFILEVTITRQAMYVERNYAARSCNNSCIGKTICITYSVCVCVCVALVIQRATGMHHIAICVLPGSRLLFHAIC